MANSVDLVIGSEAIKQVENLTSKLSLADAELLKISQSATNASKAIGSISTPSGLDKAVNNTSALNAELERQNNIIKALELELKKLAYVRQNNNKQTAAEAVNQRILNQNAIAEAKSVSSLVGAYDKLNLAHQKAFKTAQNIGAQYGITSQQFIKASEKANLLDAELKTLDTTLGRNNRHVGDYGRGYNALGNSINQLSREAPAFANSVNTGFMALSNNFPALFDAINGIRDKNKLLVADGKPTVSTLGAIAKAVFSWQTALSVGVTLLTLYGGQFVKWIMEMSKGKETISDLKLRMDTLNKSFEESSVKEAVKNVQELAINIDLAKRGYLDKQKVVDQYNESIGKTTGLVGSLDEAEKELTKNGDAYIKMTLYKAAANLALEDAAKQSLEAEKSRLKSLKEFSRSVEDADISTGGTGGLGTGAFNAKEYERDKQRRIEAQKRRRAEEIKISTDAAQQNVNIAKKFQEDAAKIAQDFDFNLFGDTKKEKVKKASQAKAKREDLDHLKSYIKPVGTIIDEINKEIDRLITEKIIANQDELPAINEQLKALLELKKQLNAVPTASDIPNIVTPDVPKASMTKLKDDWKDTFNEIAESAQKAGEIIAGFSEMNFRNEYARLESQKDISLKFAGDSAAAKAKIEEDYEKKRKEIANRENKAKQKQAIFNIAIDTAQAIMATVGKTGFAGLPLALILGALGAAQIAMVASQKIPQYFDGTDNHIGGMMLVNDGVGANFQEKVILPNGKEIMPEGRNVLMNAPKGTKVLTHEQQIMEMLNERGISMSKSYHSNGMTVQEMDGIMTKHFSKIQTNVTNIDRNGLSSWSEKNGNRTIQNANRVSRTGFRV